MSIFSVVDMDENKVSAVYPLVRTAFPDVSPQQWLDYARMARMRGGLLGLRGPQGTLYGFLTYRIEESLRLGRIFAVDHLLTFELNRAAPGRQALCEAAEALARNRGCKAIELRQGSRGYAVDASAKARGWLNLGHRLEAVVFAKMLVGGVEVDDTTPVLSAAEG